MNFYVKKALRDPQFMLFFILAVILLLPLSSFLEPSAKRVYMVRVPTMESLGVIPASLWNPSDISTGMPRPFSFGFELDPPVSFLTQAPLLVKSCV